MDKKSNDDTAGRFDDRHALETELLLASQMRATLYLHGALAHDLKGPLHAMQITLELLAGTLPDPASITPSNKDSHARQQRYVGVLTEELSRLNRALEFMLNQHIPLSKSPGSFEIREVIREIGRLIGPQARRQHVEVNFQLLENFAIVNGYRDRIRQAILNVVIHALEAMPDGGDLSVDMKVEGQKLDIAFEDTGPGVPEELLEEIYQVDFATRKNATGISLYVTRLIVESHGGEIFVEKKMERGARVRIVLPLAEVKSQ